MTKENNLRLEFEKEVDTTKYERDEYLDVFAEWVKDRVIKEQKENFPAFRNSCRSHHETFVYGISYDIYQAIKNYIYPNTYLSGKGK